MKTLKKLFKNVTIFMGGGGENHAYLKDFASSFGLKKSVKMMDTKFNIIHKNGVDYLEPFYPIGSTLMFASDFNPNSLFRGTWELTCIECSPIGVNPSSADANYKTVGKKFGEKEHKISLDEMPSHNHAIRGIYPFTPGGLGFAVPASNTSEVDMPPAYDNLKGIAKYSGGSKPHNNIQPVETFYFWKKVSYE